MLKPIVESDEIEIICEKNHNEEQADNPTWAKDLLGQKLQTVWVCENAQGYLDQVIFAFDLMRPSLAFVAEFSSLLVFQYHQIKTTDFNEKLAKSLSS